MSTELSSSYPAQRRAATLFAALGGALLIVACDDPLALSANRAVVADTLAAFAMSGTPVSFPSAYNIGSGVVVRVEPDITFDVAFDLTGTGGIKIIPARLISATRQVGGGQVVATQRVGVQIAQGTFESVTKAPNKGFKYDSTVTVTPGQTVVIEVASDACQFSLASLLYAKLVVDSVNTGSRQIFFRATRDPNCGFRSFAPGIPKN